VHPAGAPILSISSSASCDDLLSSCTSTPTTHEPVHPGSLLSSMSLMKCSKYNVTRRQSTPIGLANTRCDDVDNSDEIISISQRHYHRGSSMTFAESSVSTGDLTSAEDFVDALLKESTSASHLRHVGSPVVGGLCSPMFRRRKRNSGVQLVEPLSISRERTPSPRRAVNLNHDVLLTPEIFVDNVPFTAAADNGGGLEVDRDISPRRRTIDKSSPTRYRNVSATQLTKVADAMIRGNGQDVDQNSAEQQKKRDYEDRRLERRRQSDQVYQQHRSDDVMQSAPTSLREAVIQPSASVCRSHVAMLGVANSSSTATDRVKECDVNVESKTISYVNNACDDDSTAASDRGSSQSALSVGGKSLKERFQYLSMMYADSDNDDTNPTSGAGCMASLRQSNSASKLETSPSPCIETAVETPKYDGANEFCDEQFSQSSKCTATFIRSTVRSEEATQVKKNEDETVPVEKSYSNSCVTSATKSLQLTTSSSSSACATRREVKHQHQPRGATATSSVGHRRGGSQGQGQVKQTVNRSATKTTVRFPARMKSSMSPSRQSLNAKISTHGSAGLRTQKTTGPIKPTSGVLKTTTGRLNGQRAVTRTASPCASVTKAIIGRKIGIRQSMSATLATPKSSACKFKPEQCSVTSSPDVVSSKQGNSVLADTSALRCPSSEINHATPQRHTSSKTSSSTSRQTSPKVVSSGVADRKLTSSVANKTTRRTVPIKSLMSRDRKSNGATTSDSNVSSTEESASP